MKNENKSTYKTTILLTSIITAILVTSGIGIAYAGDFPGANTFGTSTIASHTNSAAFGQQTTASNTNTVTFGQFSRASGVNAAAFGYNTSVSGDSGVAFGHSTTAQAGYSVAIGRCNIVSGTTGAWIPIEPVFVIGNGESSGLTCVTNINAVTVLKNGNVGIGISAPTQPLQVAGIIESTSGGFKFPDGTTQTTVSVDTQLDQADVEAFGFVTGSHTVDTDTQLTETQVDVFVANNGYSTGTHTIDTTLNQADVEAFGFVTGSHTGLWTETGNTISYNGYIQLDIVNTNGLGIPPDEDCDSADEQGRMKLDSNEKKLYVCAFDGSTFVWYVI